MKRTLGKLLAMLLCVALCMLSYVPVLAVAGSPVGNTPVIEKPDISKFELENFSPPTNLSCHINSDYTLSFTWKDNANCETAYYIYRYAPGTSITPKLISLPANTTSYVDKYVILPNTTYKYFVYAKKGTETSAASNVVSVTTPTGSKPSQPTSFAVYSRGEHYVALQWEFSGSNASGFIVKCDGRPSQSLPATSRNAVFSGLTEGTDYTFSVASFNYMRGLSQYSIVHGKTNPAAVTEVKAEVSNATVKLSWKDNSQLADLFNIYRKESAASQWTKLTTVDNALTYTDSTVERGKTYLYYITVNAPSFGSTPSATVEASIPGLLTPGKTPYIPLITKPAAPSDLTAGVMVNTVTLSWKDNSANETMFKIERKAQGGIYAQIDTVTANTTSYTDSGLADGTTYYYRVCASNSAGNSAYCNEATATTAAAASDSVADPEGEDPNAEDPSTVDPDVIDTAEEDPGATDPGTAKKTVVFYLGSGEYYINGQIQSMDTTPVVSEGRTLLPVRYVGDALGATVGWDGPTKKITLTTATKTIELWVGNNTARINGVSTQIDPSNSNVSPQIVPPGRTMLPLRFIAESLGCNVDWDPVTKKITITEK